MMGRVLFVQLLSRAWSLSDQAERLHLAVPLMHESWGNNMNHGKTTVSPYWGRGVVDQCFKNMGCFAVLRNAWSSGIAKLE